jgi:DNA-binding Lrp family transcriptional regulator
MKSAVTSKDLTILNELRANSRSSLTDISKRTHIPISTLYTKLVRFSGGVISRHTSLLNFRALGYHTVALMFLQCSSPEELKKALTCSPQVNSVFKLNSEYQFMVEGIFEHIADVDAFLEKLEAKCGPLGRKLFYVVEEFQREGFLADERFL